MSETRNAAYQIYQYASTCTIAQHVEPYQMLFENPDSGIKGFFSLRASTMLFMKMLLQTGVVQIRNGSRDKIQIDKSLENFGD